MVMNGANKSNDDSSLVSHAQMQGLKRTLLREKRALRNH